MNLIAVIVLVITVILVSVAGSAWNSLINKILYDYHSFTINDLLYPVIATIVVIFLITLIVNIAVKRFGIEDKWL